MDNSGEVGRKLAELADSLVNTQAYALGTIESLREQVEQQYKAESATAQKKYEQQKLQLLKQCKRAEALSKKKVQETTNQLISDASVDCLRVAEYAQLGSIAKRGEEAYTVPLIIPLIGHGNLCFDFRNAGDINQTEDIMRFVEGRVLERSAPLQLQLISYDPLLRNLEAPFVSIQDDSFSAVRYLQSPKNLDCLLDELTEQIRRVKNQRLFDAATLVEYHQRIGSAIEPYMLVVMHNYPNGVTKNQHSRLRALADSCCEAGISFLFELTPQNTTSVEKIDVEEIEEVCTSFSWNRDIASWGNHPEWNIEFYKASLADAKNTAATVVERLSKMTSPVLPINELLPSEVWQETSEDGITFSLGKDGNELVEVCIGSNETQLHNIVITGAVGRGKSNLIKSIIYDICLRYSPDEVEFYLLDFKEGVTLYPMAPTSDSPEYLPHARVIGLEADQDFGIAVLEELIRIGMQRAKIVKPFGDNILKYRKQNPTVIMPRIILVIDEFQMFLDGGRGSYAAELLVKAARTLRAYGIHIILASQSIGGIASLLAVRDVFFAQFPIRIGLKNSPNEARATFTPLNDASAHLRYRGEVILNEDYGQLDSNRKVLTPFADDDVINGLRNRLFVLDNNKHEPPSVFDGTAFARLRQGKTSCVVLAKTNEPTVLLGKSLSVSQSPVVFTLDAIPGRNIAIVGNGLSPSNPDAPNLAEALICAAIRSLALRRNGEMDEFVILDLLPRDENEKPSLESLEALREELAFCGRTVQILGYENSRSWINSFVDESANERLEARRYIFGLGMDRLGSFDMKMQSQFSKKIKDAPMNGCHFILWWISYATMSAHLGIGSAGTFDGNALLFGTSSIAKQIIGPLSNWNGEHARVIFKDATSGKEAEKLIPFAVEEKGWFE